MSYNRLSLLEREELAEGLARQESLRDIAEDLGRSASTLCRELQRNRFSRYRPAIAERVARKRAEASHCHAKLGQNGHLPLHAYILWRLGQYWSPEQISETLKREYPEDARMQISPEAIYRYIYLLPRGEMRKELTRYLRQPKRQRGRRGRTAAGTREPQIPGMISIEERPKEVADRIIPGHWESDLLMGSLNRSALGTIVERTTRSVLLVPLAQYDAPHVRRSFARKLKSLPERLTLSLTHDQGKEMSEHQALTQATEIQVYFAHPKSPWERGTNENTNGLIRQFFPKGTDFTKVSPERVQEVEDLLNTRPRKVLDWKTPKEEFTELLLH